MCICDNFRLKREFFVLLCTSSFQQPTQTKTRKNKLRRRRRRQNFVRSSLYIIISISSIIINIIIKYKYGGETSLFLSSHDSKRIQTTQKTWVSNSHQKQLPRRRLKSSFKTQSSSRRKMSSTSPHEFMTRIKETKNCATCFSSRCLE